MAGASGIALGMLQAGTNWWGQDQQHRNQQDLMNQQMRNQMGLNRQGSDLQYQQWLRTNYPKQIEMMKKAGLNPALMYAKGGPGGTTGSQTGGSASGGQAVGMAPMDVANLSLVKAQKEKIEAETNALNSKAGLDNINTALNQHDYKWLKANDLSRQSQTLVKGIADVTGDSFQKVLGEIDNRVGKMLDVYKDPGKAIKEKAKAIKKVVEDSAKAHGIIKDNITKGIKRGWDNLKNKFD